MSLKNQKDWSSYNSPEDFQKFIDDHGYQTVMDLKKEFGGLYERMRSLKITKLVSYPRSNKRNWTAFDSIEKVQEFINSHDDIKNSVDLKKNYKGLYEKSYKNNWITELYFNESRTNWSKLNLKSKEDYKKFLEDNNITNRGSLSKNFSRLYFILKNLGYLDELLPLIPKNDWSKYNTIEEINNFIETNNIRSPKEFRTNYPGLELRIRKTLKIDKSKLNFPNRRKSTLEIKIEKISK